METIKYDKIVRDNIPNIIRDSGKECKIRFIDGNEKVQYLIKKAHEEIDEFAISKNSEEMADVLEVIEALREEIKLDIEEIDKIRKQKCENNGAFKKGIVLLEVKK